MSGDALVLRGDFACAGFAAGMAAVAREFNCFARVAAILAAIFAALLGCAATRGMCALVLFFHNSPRSLLGCVQCMGRVPAILLGAAPFTAVQRVGKVGH